MNVHRLARFTPAVALLLAVTLLSARLASASDTYTPPPPETQTWKGVITGGGARAQILLQCSHPGTGDTASIRATGLRPKGLYSFWLISGGSRRGLGKAPYQARADASGTLTYKPALGFCPSGSRLTILVNYHPSPSKSVQALRGTVAQQ